LENKGTEDVTQGQYFPRMCETLGSISSTTKKKKGKDILEREIKIYITEAWY
jgi:hypothetical protein